MHNYIFLRMLGIILISLLVGSNASASEHPISSEKIVGCWLGPRKFEIYHADGTWGVKRNEDAPEDIRGRRWQIEGDKLILKYPSSNNGFETAVFTIISCTEHELVLDADGYIIKHTRYSNDCQKKI